METLEESVQKKKESNKHKTILVKKKLNMQ